MIIILLNIEYAALAISFNLVVQDFLCVKDIEQAEGASLDEIDANQRLGALGKLHNLAVSFSRDPQKLQRFKASVGNSINSTYTAIYFLHFTTTISKLPYHTPSQKSHIIRTIS